jgi:hypothetical protein
MDSQLPAQRTGRGGRPAASFLILAAAALSIVLLLPVCEVLFAHPVAAQHPAACCTSVEAGTALDPADLATPASGSKPLPGGLAYVLGALSAPLAATTSFTGLVLPARSYHTRSSRILR